MKNREKVRDSVVSGQFYPDRPSALEKEIKTFLSGAAAVCDPLTCGLIVPHAGYMYSGRVAAEAFRTIQDTGFETVVIVAFLHRIFIRGVFIDDADSYETPLGRVPVDRESAAAVREASPCLGEVIPDELNEHSLEIQLPFLQVALKKFKLLPVYIGEQSLENAEALAAALEKFFAGKKVLFVFSTDLSHFHPYTEAVKMDQKLLRLIGDRDLARIGRLGHAGEIEACGLGPVITSLFLAERMGWEGPRLLKYANSGDVTGEKSSVVGYAAMSYRKE
ncbi:MAG: hypothetical protein BWY42_01196 [Candidatus Omnitrophica bacterium ADurb.Bin277]|nr:MAG: hypothetical protein BWY42_01196 [Candidatus Omnitrophica bacterium ADurb.Bin277]